MSLTSFVRRKEVKERILRDFPRPQPTVRGELLAPPVTRNYQLVGTAFDYVARFELQRRYPEARTRRWVAEMAAGHPDAGCEKPAIKNSRSLLQEFLKSGSMTDDLLASTLKLARLDWVIRAGAIDPVTGDVPGLAEPEQPGDIEDLRRLHGVLAGVDFGTRAAVHLNPIFGAASGLVGGADADIILDGDLVDMKVSKHLRLKDLDVWEQLVGYAVLADLERERGSDLPEIEQIGVYHARHGLLWLHPVSLVYGSPNYRGFRKWFAEKAESVFGRPVPLPTRPAPPIRLRREVKR